VLLRGESWSSVHVTGVLVVCYRFSVST
jgi:hypothetical protein